MVLGSGAFGRWSGHEGGDPMDGISALIKGPPERSPSLLAMWGFTFWQCETSGEVYNVEEGPQPTMLALWSRTSSFQNYKK